MRAFLFLNLSGSTRDGGTDAASSNPSNPLLKRGPGNYRHFSFLYYIIA